VRSIDERYGRRVNARVVAVLAVVGLAGLLWWQTRPGSSAARKGPARSGIDSIQSSPVAPALEPRPDGDREWRPTDFDPVDWQAGEEPIGWDRWVADFVKPRPGEGLLEYRDRLVPVAQVAIAPQRAAAERSLAGSITAAGLGDAGRAQVDEILGEAQSLLKQRIQNAVFGGELFGPGVAPIDSVKFARDLLDTVIAADTALRAALTPAQRRAFDDSGFDVAVYLLVATRWEQIIGVE
jgi:hypothetical protein